MRSLLNRIETDELVIFTDQVFGKKTLDKSKEIHRQLVADGKLKGGFNEKVWEGYQGVDRTGIDFSIDEDLYKSHFGRETAISIEKMAKMLRCFTIYLCGAYIFTGISVKIKAIKEFLQKNGDKDFKMKAENIATVREFLLFISTPCKQIDEMIGAIRLKKAEEKKQRQLAPIINYLVIEAEINRLFDEVCDDETFIKWFPIYFWVNITFILPLRATEMLLTPYDCICMKNGKIYLVVRRTKLKKKYKTVYYDPEEDYKCFTYEIPNNNVAFNIQKYIDLTSSPERRFLFKYNELMINEMMSLPAFNRLLAEFIENHIIGNKRYDFALHAANIDSFEIVTAGDSRPIAMANMYFQDCGEDICRQLADHEHIDTSAGYYTNITNTIWAQSIIRCIRKADEKKRKREHSYNIGFVTKIDHDGAICTSLKRQAESLDDCVEQDSLEDCMGCKYYRPTQRELDEYLAEHKQKAEESSRQMIDLVNGVMKIKDCDLTLEDIFLSAQTQIERYKIGCDIKATEELEKWQKRKNTPKTSF